MGWRSVECRSAQTDSQPALSPVNTRQSTVDFRQEKYGQLEIVANWRSLLARCIDRTDRQKRC